MTTGGYPVSNGYMGFDSKLNKYILFETEAEYEDYIAEREKEEQ